MQRAEQIEQSPIFAPPPINDYGRIDVGSYLRYLMYAYQFFILILQAIAMPGEVLVRRRFGERYLDPLMIMLGFGGIFILALGRSLSQNTDHSLLMFANAYIGIVIIHRIAIFHRDLKGETWHSQSSGLSWPILTLPARMAGSLIGRLPPSHLGEGYRERLRALVTEAVHIFVEPMLVAMAATAMARWGIELAVVFSAVSGAMLTKNVLQYHMERTRMLDVVDAAIEGEHRLDVLTGAKGPEEAQGYKVSGVRLPRGTRRLFRGAANQDRQISTNESAQA